MHVVCHVRFANVRTCERARACVRACVCKIYLASKGQ